MTERAPLRDPLPDAPRDTHQAAADRILAYIRQNGIKPAERLPSEREFSRAWDMPHHAVNRAVRGLVAAGLLRAEGLKRYPVAVPTRRVVKAPHVLLPYDPRGPGVASAEARLWEAGVINLSDAVNNNERSLESVVEDLLEQPCNGLLVRPLAVTSDLTELLHKLQAKGVPVVVLGRVVPGIPSAARDHEGMMRDLVAYLAARGHVSLACFVRPPYVEQEPEVQGYQAACCALGLASSADRVIRCPPDHPQSVIDALDKAAHGRNGITGAVAIDAEMAVALGRAAPHLRLHIPRDLSLVCVGEYTRFTPLDQVHLAPLITHTPMHDPALTRAAMGQLLDMMWQRALTGETPRKAWSLRFCPVIEERASTSQARGRKEAGTAMAREPLPPPGRWSLDRAERARQVKAARAAVYPDTQGVRTGDFLPLDLGPWINRSTKAGRVWLGPEPMQHFKAGKQAIHGVPFEAVPAPKGKPGVGYVAFRRFSVSWHRDVPLPTSVDIPVGRRVRAVWFLHGCGYVRHEAPFAEYRFMGAKGRVLGTVPLRPLAYGRADPAENAAAEAQANIQDWFPSYPQFGHATAKPAVICEGDDPLRYERYLYTLQWTPPAGEAHLACIEVRMREGTEVALALLAVTVLLA